MAAKVWSRVGGDANWSTGANWNGGTVPATTDTITFDATSVLDCTIDALGTWSGGTFTVAAAFTGNITQNVNMTTAAFAWSATAVGASGYTQAANLTTTTFSFSAGGNILTYYTISGARTFQCSTMSLSSGTVTFTSATSMICTGAVAMSGASGAAVAAALAVYAPTGTWEMRDGFSCTYAAFPADDTYLIFEQQGGTLNFTTTAACVIDVPDFVIGINFDGLFTFNKTTGAVTISISNIIPVGNSPSLTTGTFTLTGHITTSGLLRFTGAAVATVTMGASGGIIENGSGTLTGIRMTNKGLTLTTGTDIPSTPTLLFDGSVSNITYTKTSGAILIGVVTITRTGDSGITIAASTVANLGTNPTCLANQFVVNGTIQVTGVFTLTHTASASPVIMTVGAAGTISGAITEMRLGFGLTFTAGATVPAGIILTLNCTDDETAIITASGYEFASGSSLNGSIANADINIAAGTIINLGNNPSSTFTTGDIAVSGTIKATGTWSLVGCALTFQAGSTISAASALVIFINEAAFTMNATGTVTGSVGVSMDFTTGSPRTFAGAGKTYSSLARTGAGTGGLVITGTNTFSVGIFDVQGLAAHSITFPNVTTTVAGFFVKGSSGKNVSLIRTGGAGTWTLTKSSAGDVTDVAFVTISNSTVDAAPVWYAGLTPPSVNSGGNTNWIFTAPPNAGLQRRSAQMVM